MEKFNILDKFKICGTLGGTAFTWLIGEWEIGLQILLTCMALDYIMGLMWGFKTQTLNSNRAYKGLMKKLSVIVILIIATQFDKLCGNTWAFRTLVIYFYVSMESLSILETAGKFGVPIPEKLKTALEQLQDEEIEKEKNKEDDA